MVRKKRSNIGGRPKEYSEKLRTISLALPESLLLRLEKRAEESNVSRQRLIIEWLKMGDLLERFGYLTSTPKGTVFDQYPVSGRQAGYQRMTNKELADFAAELAEDHPDQEVRGVMLSVTRDEEVEAQDVLTSYATTAAARVSDQEQ